MAAQNCCCIHNMRFDVITLFPELFTPFLSQGITRRAFSSGLVDVQLHQLRDFAQDNYRRVDDRPYGGGPGMVMLPEPLERCLRHIKSMRGCGVQSNPAKENAVAEGAVCRDVPVVLFSPTGVPMTHELVSQFARGEGAVLICGRYEGIDQRFIDRFVQVEVSLGDFVLSGGEIPAIALLDAVARLQPGVLGDGLSFVQDSFNPAHDGLLDYPHYTRPERILWEGKEEPASVPGVLLSGDHAQIANWRRQEQLRITWERRPDLIYQADAAGLLSQKDKAFLEKVGYNSML